MRAPFFRMCVDHPYCEVLGKISEHGYEYIWCGEGRHRCQSWLVVDSAGEKLALANLHESPHLVSQELSEELNLFRPEMPASVCQRGHFEWYLETDGRYRCRTCKRDRALRCEKKAEPAQKPVRPRARLKRKYDPHALRVERQRRAKRARQTQATNRMIEMSNRLKG